MAWDDPYCSEEEFGERTPGRDSSNTARLGPQLRAVSRYLDVALAGRKDQPRRFNRSAAGVIRYFDGPPAADVDLWPYAGGDYPAGYLEHRILPLGDFVDLTALVLDTDGDGGYATTVDIGTHDIDGVWQLDGDAIPYPLNAAQDGRAYTGVLLRRSVTALAGFPPYPALVKATGTWGWPSVPEALRELTALVTRQLRDLQRDGLTMTTANIDQAVQMAPGAGALLNDLKRQLGNKRIGIA